MSETDNWTLSPKWISELPKRIECDQDINDIFETFESAANQYAEARLPADPHSSIARFLAYRRFYAENNIRIISDRDVDELAELLGDDVRKSIPMRAALNWIRDAQKKLKENR